MKLVRLFRFFWEFSFSFKTFPVQAAFGEILIIIRERRGKEFTESHNFYVTKYDNNEKDPALLDKQLEIKLLENKKKSKSIADAINE